MSRINPHTQELVRQRFELKYVVSEFLAQQIIDFMDPYMMSDPMGKVYPVTSLYLDNRDMAMFWSSEMGEKNRFKLRLRSHSGFAGAPIFAEVKRRVDRVVLKTRAPVRREAIPQLLENAASTHAIVDHRDNDRHARDLDYFREIQGYFDAKPCATVRYMREAYMSRMEEPLRITFDRDLSCVPTLEYTPRIWSGDNFWLSAVQVPTIMEIKFTDAYPAWVTRMIQRFGLQRTSLAKYVECMRMLKHEHHDLLQAKDLFI